MENLNIFTLAGISIILIIQTGFVSYVKNKFKNHAKLEDTSKITTTTEKAKINVQAPALIEEKRWELKKELYFDLIDILTKQLLTIQSMRNEIKHSPKDQYSQTKFKKFINEYSDNTKLFNQKNQ